MVVLAFIYFKQRRCLLHVVNFNFVTIYDAKAHAQCNEMGISPFLNSSAESAVYCVTRMLQLGWIYTAM